MAKYATKEQWWGFVQCQNFEGRESVGRPEVALKCANAVQIDWETSGVGRCAGLDGKGKGSEGVRLLHKSVRLGQSLQITYVQEILACFKPADCTLSKSCTILISARKVCVHDGTWKECEVSKIHLAFGPVG